MKVIVMLGGPGAERAVSLQSGLAVLDALRRGGYKARAYDPVDGWLDSETEATLRRGALPQAWSQPPETTRRRIDLERLAADLSAVSDPVIFNVLHGQWGEDGAAQAIFETLDIPYTGSGPTASALAMDKHLSKAVLRGAGIPVAASLAAPAGLAEIAVSIGFPCIVKPSNEGSSVDLALVEGPGGIEAAVSAAARPGAPALIEAFLPGREFSVGVLGDEALEPGEILPSGSELFDYARKYQPGGAREIFPAQIEPEARGYLKKLAGEAHRALRLRDYSRIDFRMDAAGRFFCLEANSLPGMTPLSLLPQSAGAAGIGFDSLVSRMLERAAGWV